MVKVYSFDSIEELFAAEDSARSEADKAVCLNQAVLKPGDHFLRLIPEEQIAIWGVILDPVEEERKCGASPEEVARAKQLYDAPHMKNLRFTRCFSEIVPEGELGDVHVATIAAHISPEAFELGRENGWPSDLHDLMQILGVLRPSAEA